MGARLPLLAEKRCRQIDNRVVGDVRADWRDGRPAIEAQPPVEHAFLNWYSARAPGMSLGLLLRYKELMKEAPSLFSQRRRFLKGPKGGDFFINLRDPAKSKLSVGSVSSCV